MTIVVISMDFRYKINNCGGPFVELLRSAKQVRTESTETDETEKLAKAKKQKTTRDATVAFENSNTHVH